MLGTNIWNCPFCNFVTLNNYLRLIWIKSNLWFPRMNCKCYSVLFLMPFLGSFFYTLMTEIFWLFLHSHLFHIVFWSEKVVCKHMCSQTVYAYVISSCNTLCLPSMRPFTILDRSIPPFYRFITSNCQSAICNSPSKCAIQRDLHAQSEIAPTYPNWTQ